jgi:hypothetical protein
MKMKRILLFIIIGVGLLTGCKSESSNNGDLDGLWQMTGRPGLTWSFQGKILEFRDVNQVHHDLMAKFRHEGNLLIVYDLRVVDRDAGDPLVTESEMEDLRAYGINDLVEEQFQIRQLTSDDMHLESDDESLHFRKY